MGDQVVICDRFGIPLKQVRANVPRTWVMSSVGEGQLQLSRFDSDCNSDVIAIGNMVWVISEEGLPDWVGIMDGDIVFDGMTATVALLTPEIIFDWRVAPYLVNVSGTAGWRMLQFIHYANAVEPTLLTPGTMYFGGSRGEKEEVGTDTILKDIERLQENMKFDWTVEPAIKANENENSQMLQFNVNVYKRPDSMEEATCDAILHEGYNMAREGMQYIQSSADLANSVFGFGNADTNDVRPTFTYTSQASKEKYGLRQHALSVSEDGRGGVIDAVIEHLRLNAGLKRRFACSVINVGGLFKNLKLSAVLLCRSFSAGFGDGIARTGFLGYLQILGMNYEPEGRTMELVVEFFENIVLDSAT